MGEVYPRAYGEAFFLPVLEIRGEGLSPRLRGSQVERQEIMIGKRSIPAPTGKPQSCLDDARLSAVYPRAYGEATARLSPRADIRGLSPRLRGSPPKETSLEDFTRSIPAPTGKPRCGWARLRDRQVYPRAYGEAD